MRVGTIQTPKTGEAKKWLTGLGIVILSEQHKKAHSRYQVEVPETAFPKLEAAWQKLEYALIDEDG